MGIQVMHRSRNGGQGRTFAEWLLRIRADPAGKPDRGGLDLLCSQTKAIVDQRRRQPGSKHVGLRAPPAPVGRVGGLDLQAGFDALALQEFDHALLEMPLQPGHRSVAAQVGECHRTCGFCGLGFPVETRRPGRELVAACDFLHHADRAHGHEVACQAEPVRAVEGQVVEADLERRVGTLAGRHGHLAGSGGGGLLRRKLARAVLCELQGLIERQGGLGRAGERKQCGAKDKQRGQAAMDRHLASAVGPWGMEHGFSRQRNGDFVSARCRRRIGVRARTSTTTAPDRPQGRRRQAVWTVKFGSSSAGWRAAEKPLPGH